MRKIVLVPDSDPRHGLGHFKRLAFYIEQGLDADILIPTAAAAAHFGAHCNAAVRRRFVRRITDRRYTLLIADVFRLSLRALRRYRHAADIVCALDARGRGSSYCDYVIDILPRITGRAGNISLPTLLPIAERSAATMLPEPPPATESQRTRPLRVLLYFGGSRRAGRTSRALRYLMRTYRSVALNMTIVLPRSAVLPALPTTLPARWRCAYLQAPQSLARQIAAADIVLTSFGLTALEATLRGAHVVIFDPGRYHARCTQALQAPASARQHYRPRFFSAATFDALMDQLSHSHPTRCPACSHTRYRLYARFPLRSFARCQHCGMHFMILHGKQTLAYDRHYFDAEYRRQYGRSYVDDYAHIYRLGAERLALIARLCARRAAARRALLDIGCAYGPFLSAAADHGFDCYGIDVNSEAIAYVRQHLDAHAVCCSIDQLDAAALWQRRYFDVITLWYVIEHFASIAPLLTKINALLPFGGVLAFSTPNRISLPFRLDRASALRSSPVDHYTLWSPRSARRLLLRFGLRVRHIALHGVHAVQYPHLPPRCSRTLATRAQQGTTFSVYAEKVDEVVG